MSVGAVLVDRSVRDGHVRHAFQLQFEEKSFELREPRKVLQVAQRCDFVRLAKAIATELRWLPEDELLAVETLEEMPKVELSMYWSMSNARCKQLSIDHIGYYSREHTTYFTYS